MNITRTSPLTGEIVTKDINVTPAQIALWTCGELAQNAFPNADTDEREFIMTGYTDYDWNSMFGEIDDKTDWTDVNTPYAPIVWKD